MYVNKRGQTRISFGMIFSIILIIIFITFSFYAIQKLLGVKDVAQSGKFTENLQNDVNKVWRSPQGESKYQYTLPSKVELVCFTDYSLGSSGKGPNRDIYKELELLYYGTENLFFYPKGSSGGLDAREIKNIALNKTTESENPFCIENIKGVTNLTIKKDFNEALVTITR